MLYDAKLLDPIHHFLACKTPQAWIDKASQPENLAIILGYVCVKCGCGLN